MNDESESVFFAKTWYLWVAAFVLGFFALFCAVMGPMFLLGILDRADGKPAMQAGVALSIMAVPLALVASLSWYQLWARRKPLLRICRDGIEVNVIGASSLDAVPAIPKWFRVAWLVLSLQGFRKQVGWIQWSEFRSAEISGKRMERFLTIDASIDFPSFRKLDPSLKRAESVIFRDSDFKISLDSIESSINRYSKSPLVRRKLPLLRE